MHLPIKVIRQPPIIIQPAKDTPHRHHKPVTSDVRSAHSYHSAPSTPLLLPLRLHRLSDTEELLVRPRHLLSRLGPGSPATRSRYSCSNRPICFNSAFVCLISSGVFSNRRLCDIDASVAFVDVLLQIAHVVVFEAPFCCSVVEADSYSVFRGSEWTLGQGPRSCFVLVKRSCGQVPTRKERQTFGSVMESWAARG